MSGFYFNFVRNKYNGMSGFNLIMSEMNKIKCLVIILILSEMNTIECLVFNLIMSEINKIEFRVLF